MSSDSRYSQLMAAGLCPRCGKIETGGIKCEKCRIYERDYRRANIPRAGTTKCGICQESGHNRATCPKKADKSSTND